MTAGLSKTGIVARLARLGFVRNALAEEADLSVLRTRPAPRVWLGLGLVALSYLIGWPAVGLLAAIAYRLGEPLIVAVGGPLTYGLSHLVFLAGSWLAGAQYVRVLLHWGIRRTFARLAGSDLPPDLS
jgi:hypothetical protein